MRLKKKMLGIILCLVLVLGLMPGMSLTAYAEEPPTITILPEGAGTVTIEASTDGEYEYILTANPNKGYGFRYWGHGGGSMGNIGGNRLGINGEDSITCYFGEACTVTYKVVGGTWSDGTTADKTVNIVKGYPLTDVPTGMVAATGYTGGSWDSDEVLDNNTSIKQDKTYTYTFAKVPYDGVPTSTGSVNDITGTTAAAAESNPFETKIENKSNLTTLLSLTDAEVAEGVNVWLDVQDMSASVPQTDKNLIKDKSGDYTVGLYLDINLFKKVGGNDATKVTETNGKVKASIAIPESLWKSGRTFEIIRVHDGVATAIAGTYDEKTHVFTFETDKFSTYALAYKDQASSSDSGTTSKSGSSNSSNSTQPTSPKTGDSNDIRVWYLLLIASLGGLGLLFFSKKKED